MDKDMQSQLIRVKELLQEFENACNDNLASKDVSGKTENLAQEVLIKVRYLLDQIMYGYFEKHYLPNLSEKDKKSARVYFPIVSKKEDLNSVLCRAKMGDLEIKNNNFYKFLNSVQPYNKDYIWLKHLAYYASEKHIRLTPQKKVEIKRVTVSRGGGSISWGSGVTFGSGVSVMGVPIDANTQMPVPNNITETKVENWVSFLFNDSNINVLVLCKISVTGLEKIIEQVSKYI